VLARLPISMIGIGIVLLIESSTGSYALAGAVAGTFALTQAVASPALARAVDRFGQAKVMLPAIGVHVTGLVLILVLAEAGAPRWAIFLAAVLAGATIGSLGALVRARWSYLLTGRERGPELLHTAYSLESVFDEVVFVTGPLLVTLLSTRFYPGLGLITSALAVAIGGTLLMLQRGSEPRASGRRGQDGSRILRAPGMIVVLLGMVCVGSIFGSVEILVVAFADERHQLGAAGLVLACFAFGSLLAGLVYGSVQWRIPAGRRFRFTVVLLAAGIAPTLLVHNLPQLAAVTFLCGFTISPMLISGHGTVREIVVPARLTEGLTWISSSLGVGASTGATLAGAAVDALGAQQAFIVPVGSGTAAAIIVLLGGRRLSQPAPAVGEASWAA
jgi:MFS family permease